MGAVPRSAKIDGGRSSRRIPSRLIPKRGRVKVAIAAALAHRLSSIFSLNPRNRCAGS
ncbi:hypothetical protein ACJRO7_021468 [Eucalyptus globulus]|uniref:Uncharacterized protein n=1 Tax=Eucalyptus globulus TaxID=34317 RepID=A0ABD3KRM3_EUCGL